MPLHSSFSIVSAISGLLELYSLLILIRVIMSWFMQNKYNQVYLLLLKITEPVLHPIRKLLPQTGLDFSPLIAIILIRIISRLLYRI